MQHIKALCFVLLAGTCTGIFFYLQTVPFLRLSSATGGDATIFWTFSSFAPFGAAVLSANLVILLLWLGYSWGYARFTGIGLKPALHLDAPTYLPLSILALALLQFSSFFTRYFEGVLLLSQNAGYILLLIAVLAVYYLKAENLKRARQTVLTRQTPQALTPPPTWKMKVGLFLLGFALYALVGLRVSDPDLLGPGGDEPHYLLITHSILFDHDLQILNNYKQRDYQAFFPGELKPHVSIGRHGVRYPGHPLGLPVLLLPAYALDGYRGCVWLMNGLAALLAVQLYLLSFAMTQRTRLALLLWGIVCFTTPLLLYASEIYPEIPSALLLSIALRIIIQTVRPVETLHCNVSTRKTNVHGSTGSPRTVSESAGIPRTGVLPALVLGGTLACLPWLQQRMILPAALLLGYYVFSLKDRLRTGGQWNKPAVWAAVIPGVLLALSGLAMAGFYFSLYKNPLPNAPYASVGMPNVFSPEILLKQGLLGLLCDQEAGLFMYAPYFVFMLPGFGWLFRRRCAQAGWLLLIILSIYIPCGGFILKWRGAWSPAARYMVVLIPLFLIPLSACVQRLTRPFYRYLFGLLTILSFAWSALFAAVPFAAIMSRGGVNGVFEASSGLVELPRYFPFITEAGLANPAVTGIWLILIAALTVGVYRAITSPAAVLPRKSPLADVFKCYGWGLGIFLSVTSVAGHPSLSTVAPQLNQNRQLHTLLAYFQDFALGRPQIPQFQGLSAENFRFAYLNEAKSGQVGPGKARFIVTGPREPFPRGKYTAYFKMAAAENTTTDEIATLDIVAGRGAVNFKHRRLRGVDFANAGQSELMPLAFELDRDVADLETRVYFQNRVDLRVEKIYLEPDLSDFCYRAGLAAFSAENYAAAQTLLRSAVARSEHAPALYQLGVIEQKLGNWDASVKIFRQVLTRAPQLADAAYRLGLAWQAQQQWEDARQALEQATRLLPTHLDAWQALEKTYRQLKLEDQSQNAAQTITRLYQPQFPFAVNLGNQMLFRGYRVQNPAPGRLALNYYWQALTPMTADYAIFVHFKRFGVKFQQDHAPERLDAATGQQQPYPTRQWQPGELVQEHFDIAAPAGTFDLVLGVWEPLYTQTHLAIRSPAQTPLFRRTEVSLGQITVK